MPNPAEKGPEVKQRPKKRVAKPGAAFDRGDVMLLGPDSPTTAASFGFR